MMARLQPCNPARRTLPTPHMQATFTLRRVVLALAAAAVLAAAQPAMAKCGHAGSPHSAGHAAQAQDARHARAGKSTAPRTTHAAPHATAHAPAHAGATQAKPGVPRDASGKIARSPAQKNAFEKSHPCPSTGKSSGACPGYVVDHVVPLKRGGADRPRNMRWQTTDDARAKDRAE